VVSKAAEPKGGKTNLGSKAETQKKTSNEKIIKKDRTCWGKTQKKGEKGKKKRRGGVATLTLVLEKKKNFPGRGATR